MAECGTVTINGLDVPITAAPVAARSGNSSVVSGYDTIAEAIAGESDVTFTGVTAAGTVAGTIVGPAGFPAVDDALTGAWVVLKAAAPANGMAAQVARVTDYVGATRTMTLDRPYDFTVGVTIDVIFPISIMLRAPAVEDVVLSKNISLDLGGNELDGSLGVADVSFAMIQFGTVRDGIVKTGAGAAAVLMEYLTVGRREASDYAFLMDNVGNVGSVEARNCIFRGVVAGRRGVARWEIKDCEDGGVVDGENNVPYRLVESIAAIAIVVTNVSIGINSQFAGSLFYSENSITSGAPNFVQINGTILGSVRDPEGLVPASRKFELARAVGAGVLTLTTVSPSAISLAIGVTNRGGSFNDVADFSFNWSLLALQDFTGTATLTLATGSGAVEFTSYRNSHGAAVTVEGTSGTMTGTATLGGTALKRFKTGQVNFCIVNLKGELDAAASITVSGGQYRVEGPDFMSLIRYSSDQTLAAAASVTISASMSFRNMRVLSYFTSDSLAFVLSSGTYTFSGLMESDHVGAYQCSLGTNVSGGTYSITGNNRIGSATNRFNTTLGNFHAGTGGTLDISGLYQYIGGHFLQFSIASTASAAAVQNVSGLTLLSHATFDQAGNWAYINVSDGTCDVTGDVMVRYVATELLDDGGYNDFVFVDAAGTLTSGPANVRFEYCTLGNYVGRSAWFGIARGTGTISWTAGNFIHSYCEFGLLDIFGTVLDSYNAYECVLDGPDPGGGGTDAVVFSGTRPTFYRFWKCEFTRGRPFASAAPADGQPEIIDDWLTLISDAAFGAGQLLRITAAGDTYTTPVAADMDDAVALEGTAGAGVVVVGVRRGVMFVRSVAGVVGGDNLNRSAGTPSSVATAAAAVAGQNIGRALQAVAAGSVYAKVDLK